MDFQNVNSLNVRLNLVSGNLLPMMNRDSSFPFFWRMHSGFVWIVQFIITITMVPGCIYVPLEKALKDGLICLVILMEICLVILRYHARKDLMYQLIQKLNEILYIADETMKNVVTATLESVKIPLNFYWSAGMVSMIAWYGVPFLSIYDKNLFYYEDYRIPAAFTKQPFSRRVFVLTSIFILIIALYIFLRKASIATYTVHLVLMLTAQYRYIALKIAIIFQEGNEGDESQKAHSSELDRKKAKEIRALCRHHNDVIYMTSLLKELMSLNFSLIYVNTVFRFCFIGILLSTIASTTLWEAIWIVMFTSEYGHNR